MELFNEMNRIIYSLENSISNYSFEFLTELLRVNEHVLCWEILADLICEKEDKGFLNLKGEKEKIIQIGKGLNLKEAYISIFNEYL